MVRIAHKLSAWGVQSDFAAVSSHPAALGFTRTWSFPFLARTIVIIHTVVVLTQHRQIRRLSMTTILAGIEVVNLASIRGYVAVRPRTHQVFA